MKSKKSNFEGKFIVVEGGELAGKTTLVEKLASKIRKDTGLEVVTVAAPGTTPYGLLIRRGLKEGVIPSTYLAPLMWSSIAEMHQSTIIPAIKRGAVVICDRYIASTFSYQCYVENVTTSDDLLSLTDNLLPHVPDYTIYLNFSPDVFLDRQSKLLESGREIMENDLMPVEKAAEIHEGFRKYFSLTSKGGRNNNVLQVNPCLDKLDARDLAFDVLSTAFDQSSA